MSTIFLLFCFVCAKTSNKNIPMQNASKPFLCHWIIEFVLNEGQHIKIVIVKKHFVWYYFVVVYSSMCYCICQLSNFDSYFYFYFFLIYCFLLLQFFLFLILTKHHYFSSDFVNFVIFVFFLRLPVITEAHQLIIIFISKQNLFGIFIFFVQ